MPLKRSESAKTTLSMYALKVGKYQVRSLNFLSCYLGAFLRLPFLYFMSIHHQNQPSPKKANIFTIKFSFTFNNFIEFKVFLHNFNRFYQSP